MTDLEFEAIKTDVTLWKGYEEWLDQMEARSFYEREHEAGNKLDEVK